jgi:hypothetical protein
MAKRSVVVQLVNNTQYLLSIDSNNFSLDHGEWTTKPPPYIQDNKTGQWESESDGVMTGTEGHCGYFIQDEYIDTTPNWVYVYWDDPYYGGNERGCSVSNSDLYTCTPPSSYGGNNATMVFTLTRNNQV